MERLPGTIPLDQARDQQLRRFVCGKPLAAGEAFPSSANLVAISNQAGINNPGVISVTTKGTMHGSNLILILMTGYYLLVSKWQALTDAGG